MKPSLRLEIFLPQVELEPGTDSSFTSANLLSFRGLLQVESTLSQKTALI